MFSYCFDNVAKTCSYGLKISRNTQIKYILHFKAYVPALVTFNRSCLSASGMINASNCRTSDACCLFEGGIFCFCDPEALKGSVQLKNLILCRQCFQIYNATAFLQICYYHIIFINGKNVPSKHTIQIQLHCLV